MQFKSYEYSEHYTVIAFSCDFKVTTAGDGLWNCEAGRVVHVTGINIAINASNSNVYAHITVEHDSDWTIYTDTAFEEAISNALGTQVHFTEQGMQEDGIASME